MLVQIYIKNEPLAACDLLIAKENASVTIPMSEFAKVQGKPIEVLLVKEHENIGMKAAVAMARAIREAQSLSSPVFVQCPDKAVLDGICSMEFEGPAGGTVKCVPAGTKPPAPPRVRNRAKPKPPATPAQPVPKPDEPAKQDAAPAGTKPDEKAGPADPIKESAPDDKPAETQPDAAEIPLVKGDEVNLESPPAPPEPEPDIAEANAPKAIKLLTECGVPSGQVPGVIEAIREAMDAQITLPMQVKLKLAKDGATGEMDPEETAKRIAPKFNELKKLVEEIDGAAKP